MCDTYEELMEIIETDMVHKIDQIHSMLGVKVEYW